jgi:hypothetical protein
MRRVMRSEIVDYVTYGERREEFRKQVLAEKDARRVHVEVLTFLFENTTTIRYQIQEMMRVERIVKEADIQHEIDTYNELLGAPGALGCTMLIEIDDAAERALKLVQYLTVPSRVYVRFEDGTKIYAKVDDRQNDGGRASAVQYLQFEVGGKAPVAVGVDHPALTGETLLTPVQKAALEEDLSAR